VCVIDAETLTLGNCVHVSEQSVGLAAQPDAVVYVPRTKEVWVTMGAPPLGIAAPEKAILIFDASQSKTLTLKTKLVLGGSAEGYAQDRSRGLFFTSIEERGETIAVDARKHQVVSRWHSGCDEPHGVAYDQRRRFLFVACEDRVIALDTAHNGKVLGSVSTGNGLDNIDYSEADSEVYAAALQDARLTEIKVDDHGNLTIAATAPTSKGTRSAVAGDRGVAYVADPYGGRILKFTSQ
jgi:DNA-binding beta-propeller fold protein YncE